MRTIRLLRSAFWYLLAGIIIWPMVAEPPSLTQLAYLAVIMGAMAFAGLAHYAIVRRSEDDGASGSSVRPGASAGPHPGNTADQQLGPDSH